MNILGIIFIFYLPVDDFVDAQLIGIENGLFPSLYSKTAHFLKIDSAGNAQNT